MNVTSHEMEEDPSVLIDLLQAMVSETSWAYAEMWMPSAERIVISASYVKPSKKDELSKLDYLSRSMALKPGLCLPGSAWQRNQYEWHSKLDSSAAFQRSPRMDALREAGFASGLSFPIQAENGQCLAIIAFFALRHVEESEKVLDAIRSLAASSAPYIEHLTTTQRRNDLDKGNASMSSEGASRYLDASISSPSPSRKPRTTIRYKAPTTSSPIPASPAAQSSKSEPRVANREAPISYMVALTTGFLKYPQTEDGTPSVFRVSVAWNVLEQLCDTAGSFRECLALIRDELRPALYSDDLMAADDGTALIRIPFFAQLEYRKGQVAAALAAAEAVRASRAELEAELERLSGEVAQSQAEVGRLRRKVWMAERKVVKKNLSTLLERRQMQAEARAALAGEMEALTATLQGLEAQLRQAREGNKRDIIEGAAALDQMQRSLHKCGTLRPPMEPALVVPPVPHSRLHGPFLPVTGFEEEVEENKRQLLLLRNAGLSAFEATYAAGSGQDHSEFKLTMEGLELEIQAADAALLRGLAPAHYELVLPQPGAALAPPEPEPDLPLSSPLRRLDAPEEAGLSQAEQEAATEAEYWAEKGSNQAVTVNVWKLWEKRRTTGRELPRELDEAEVTRWVYGVLQRKANADVAAQRDPAVPLLTVEQTLFAFLDDKYLSRHVANMVAYDVLALVEARRETSSLFALFAAALSGGWFDATWKYVLRTQQFAAGLYPEGFASPSELEDFLVRFFYPDHPHSDVERVLRALHLFAPYNRQLAEARGQPGGERVSAELLAELVAELVEQGEEPRLQKLRVMLDIKDMLRRAPVAYDDFERFADLCVPSAVDVAACRLYYRMLLKAHPDRLFPPDSLAMSVVSLELEMLLAHHSFSQELVIDSKHTAKPLDPPPTSASEDSEGKKPRRSMRRTSVVTFKMIEEEGQGAAGKGPVGVI